MANRLQNALLLCDRAGADVAVSRALTLFDTGSLTVIALETAANFEPDERDALLRLLEPERTGPDTGQERAESPPLAETIGKAADENRLANALRGFFETEPAALERASPRLQSAIVNAIERSVIRKPSRRSYSVPASIAAFVIALICTGAFVISKTTSPPLASSAVPVVAVPLALAPLPSFELPPQLTFKSKHTQGLPRIRSHAPRHAAFHRAHVKRLPWKITIKAKPKAITLKSATKMHRPLIAER